MKDGAMADSIKSVEDAAVLLEEKVRIRVFVPERQVSWIRATLDQLAGEIPPALVGTLGEYYAVRYETSLVEHFAYLPRRKANPREETPPTCICVETWCSPAARDTVVARLRERHPYEHPLIEVSTVQLARPDPKRETQQER